MESPTSPAEDIASIGLPTRADGAKMWSMVNRHGGLDLNSPYAYLALAEDFAQTSAAARTAGDDLAGFVLGYSPPRRPGTLFVWQVGVDPRHRGKGLARRMICDVLDRPDQGFRTLEATVTPDNVASRRLFASIAEAYGARCDVITGFRSDDFPADAGAHDREDRFVIGPLRHGPRD